MKMTLMQHISAVKNLILSEDYLTVTHGLITELCSSSTHNPATDTMEFYGNTYHTRSNDYLR